jgi:riboflavin kinase/FMN adenylyltransferase
MSSPEQRCALMREEGIEQVLIMPFDRDVAHLTPEQFVEQVLVRKLGVRAVVLGHDFRFGYKQSGNVRVLEELGRKYGFTTEVVKAVTVRGRLVSSTALRQLIEAGRVSRKRRACWSGLTRWKAKWSPAAAWDPSRPCPRSIWRPIPKCCRPPAFT